MDFEQPTKTEGAPDHFNLALTRQYPVYAYTEYNYNISHKGFSAIKYEYLHWLHCVVAIEANVTATRKTPESGCEPWG